MTECSPSTCQALIQNPSTACRHKVLLLQVLLLASRGLQLLTSQFAPGSLSTCINSRSTPLLGPEWRPHHPSPCQFRGYSPIGLHDSHIAAPCQFPTCFPYKSHQLLHWQSLPAPRVWVLPHSILTALWFMIPNWLPPWFLRCIQG
jgi:hypothetical protein